MNIAIERATVADAETLVQVQIAAFHHDAVMYPGVEVGGPPGYDSLAHITKRIEEDVCYKILADGQCIGGIVIFLEGEGHCHLDVIVVHPDYHNRGIGKQAMQFIEQAHPAQRWTLHTPLYAIRNQHFYEKVGYVNVGEEDDDGFMLIAYEKRVE